jgi:hypothetical protein
MATKKRARKASGSDRVLTLAFIKEIGDAQTAKKAATKAYDVLKAKALKALKAKETIPTADDGALFKLSFSEFPKAVFDHEGEAAHWKKNTQELAVALAVREKKKNPATFARNYMKRNSFEHPDDAPGSRFTVGNW